MGTASAIQDGRFNIQEEPHGGLKTQDESENGMPKLAHREAHTPYADAAEYLASAFGLRRAPGSTPGTVVYVYHAVDLRNAEGCPQKAVSDYRL